jgi:ribosomal protein S18 acetylase RimI-like enzyme
LFVDIDTRRRGLGRALIEATYREADKRGATRTYWATQADNAAARRIYDRVAKPSGFVQYRR